MLDYLKEFERLVKIVYELREKCPWDKEQTMESIRQLTIEEIYELSESILNNQPENIKKELGDILMHLVFYSRIAEEKNFFNLSDVLNGVCEKLIYRHPHVYGNVIAETTGKVKENWEQLKMKEGNKSVLSGVPNALPALIKAQRIQEKTAAVGFDWENKNQVWEKVEEELQEFKNELGVSKTTNIDKKKMEQEFGDLLFSLINFSRFIGINAENALEKTNQKFIHRFNYIEKGAIKSGKKLKEMTLEEMEVLWQEAKDI